MDGWVIGWIDRWIVGEKNGKMSGFLDATVLDGWVAGGG